MKKDKPANPPADKPEVKYEFVTDKESQVAVDEPYGQWAKRFNAETKRKQEQDENRILGKFD